MKILYSILSFVGFNAESLNRSQYLFLKLWGGMLFSCLSFSGSALAFECITDTVLLTPGNLTVPAGGVGAIYTGPELTFNGVTNRRCAGSNNAADYQAVVTRSLVSPYGLGSSDTDQFITTPINCLKAKIQFRFTNRVVPWALVSKQPSRIDVNMRNSTENNILYNVGAKIQFRVDCPLPLTAQQLPKGVIANATAVVAGSIATRPLSASASVELATPLTITQYGCFISAGDKSINLGNVNASAFRGVNNTAGIKRDVLFTLNCGNVQTTTTVKFTGTSDANIPAVLGLTGASGRATGVGVQLSVNGNIAPLGADIPLGTLPAGTNNVTVSAQYIQTAAAITAGDANASATINVTYR